jgi:hypothetical protein
VSWRAHQFLLRLLKDLRLPDFRDYAVDVPRSLLFGSRPMPQAPSRAVREYQKGANFAIITRTVGIDLKCRHR